MTSQDRLARARAVLRDVGADAAVIASPADRCYLTGFSGDLGAPSTKDVVVVSRDTATLVTYPIHAGWAKGEIHQGIEVVANRDWIEAVATLVGDAGWAALAIDDGVIPHASVESLRARLPSPTGLVPLGSALGSLRARKDATEVDAMRRSAGIADEVLVDAAGWLDEGMTEREVARRINASFYQRGADDLAFSVIVASGPHAANPHHRPTDRVLAAGDAVVIDLGCRLDRYCSDLTRTLSVGPPTERFATLYNATLASRDAAKALIEPGRPAREVAKAANDVVRGLGLEDLLMHGLGHGVGLQVHEAPAIRETSEDILEIGHVFSVEPGVYDPTWGGVRTEDVVVVTESGHETITTAPTIDLGHDG